MVPFSIIFVGEFCVTIYTLRDDVERNLKIVEDFSQSA